MIGPSFARGCALLLALSSFGCRDTRTETPATTTEPRAAQSRVEDFPHVSAADSTRLEAIRAPWLWVGALHHEAMQEALNDPDVPTFVGRGPTSAACAAQLRYMRRYAAKIDAIAANLHTAGLRNDVESRARRMGACRQPDSQPPSPTSAVGLYATRLAISLHSARNLSDARRIIDAVHLDALRDPLLSADDLETIAVLTVVAIASTNEWYPLGARKSETRRADPRILAVTNDTSDPVDPDVLGCVLMGGSGLDCVIGALLGSLVYWWPY